MTEAVASHSPAPEAEVVTWAGSAVQVGRDQGREERRVRDGSVCPDPRKDRVSRVEGSGRGAKAQERWGDLHGEDTPGVPWG